MASRPILLHRKEMHLAGRKDRLPLAGGAAVVTVPQCMSPWLRTTACCRSPCRVLLLTATVLPRRKGRASRILPAWMMAPMSRILIAFCAPSAGRGAAVTQTVVFVALRRKIASSLDLGDGRRAFPAMWVVTAAHSGPVRARQRLWPEQRCCWVRNDAAWKVLGRDSQGLRLGSTLNAHAVNPSSADSFGHIVTHRCRQSTACRAGPVPPHVVAGPTHMAVEEEVANPVGRKPPTDKGVPQRYVLVVSNDDVRSVHTKPTCRLNLLLRCNGVVLAAPVNHNNENVNLGPQRGDVSRHTRTVRHLRRR